MREDISRRSFLKNFLGAAGMAALPLRGLAQGNQATGMERGEMGRLAAAFKSSFSVPALSVAISRKGQFVYDQGFGFDQGIAVGNTKDLGPTNMSSLFRIADVTMPITAQPGARFQYCSRCVVLAAYALEQIVGQSWEAYTRTHIFVPLGMATASFGLLGLEQAPDRAQHASRQEQC